VTTSPQPGSAAADPELASTVRLLHRRHGWARMVVTCFFAFALGEGAYASAQSQGTPPPSWFLAVVIGLGALTVVGIAGAVVDGVQWRRKRPKVKAQAVSLAAQHPRRHDLHHFPPRHWLIWTLRWVGMLLILVVAVVSVPGIVDGVAYLSGADPTVTFDPISHQTSCGQYSCTTSTDGILETGGAGTNATWPDVVPLDKPFQVRQPLWRWGLGQALINSDGIAAAAVVLSLLIEGLAVWVVISLVRLTRNLLRRRHQRAAHASVPVG
jgi:hypothetical protein